MEPSGSLWVPHLKKNYIIRENPANLLGNPGARLPFHMYVVSVNGVLQTWAMFITI